MHVFMYLWVKVWVLEWSHVINHEYWTCVGLSPDLQSMEQIRRIMRPTDVPDQGLLCDLLWSDPDKETMGWGENDRGVSFTFGAEVVAKFLHKHDLDLICRAHQVIASLISETLFFFDLTIWCEPYIYSAESWSIFTALCVLSDNAKISRIQHCRVIGLMLTMSNVVCLRFSVALCQSSPISCC